MIRFLIFDWIKFKFNCPWNFWNNKLEFLILQIISRFFYFNFSIKFIKFQTSDSSLLSACFQVQNRTMLMTILMRCSFSFLRFSFLSFQHSGYHQKIAVHWTVLIDRTILFFKSKILVWKNRVYGQLAQFSEQQFFEISKIFFLWLLKR